MNKVQAKAQLKQFMGDNSKLTFTIKSFSGERWVAQCNEIDSIVTCGIGYDASVMESTMQDAIITAARIPREYAHELLKRVWNNDLSVRSPLESNTIATLFQSTYAVH